MKARQVRFNRIGELFRMLGARFMSNPREFFSFQKRSCTTKFGTLNKIRP
ncbi:hypothetical protein [Candidatus Nitrotoga sp. AM1P]